MKTVVITGGPCSGKTTAMKVLRERFASDGVPAVFVDEACTDLIMAGVTPQSCGCMAAFQPLVAALQLEREHEAKQAAATLSDDALIVCDRGICDGAAYISADEYGDVLDALGMTADTAYARYDAVFCLESAAKLGTDAYTLENNPARMEGSLEEALRVDARTIEAWKGHPELHFIANADTFDEKVEHLIGEIRKYWDTHK